jgi:DNA helicase-2/ATP-dependent DNA helicase PcrA
LIDLEQGKPVLARRNNVQGLVAGLTKAQREAVEHFEGPLLILAGPGSGKTRVITHRVARLLQRGVPPQNILALTFTNKAAEEMRGRVERLVSQPGVWMGTFHRFCARLLRVHAQQVGLQENYTIYDAEDSLRALRTALTAARVEIAPFTLDAVAHAISWAKHNLITPENYSPPTHNALGLVVRQAYVAYQRHLLAVNAVDFDDLLVHVATLLRENPDLRRCLDERYRFILVDEYQDTNFAQYVIVRALSLDHPNLSVTGDPDQSIYGWRGANLNNILEFEQDFPNVRIVRLEQNYRSTQCILRVAAALIAHNRRRKEKGLFTHNGTGRPVRLALYSTEQQEAEDIAARIAAAVAAGQRRFRDFAIFYRMNALSRTLEAALRAAAVPYQLVSGLEFFQRREIKDVLAYLRLLNNPHDQAALRRIVNAPPRGIGHVTLEKLERHADAHCLTMLDCLRRVAEIPDISRQIAARVRRLAELFDRLRAETAASMEEIIGHVLSASGYLAMLEASRDPADQERLANVQELLTVARHFDERHPGGASLDEFLEETALVSDTDNWQIEADRVSLMTLHAAKGLEFPVVFIIAVEEGILPHERCRRHEDSLEEERRLLFVGITRAKEELQLSFTQMRDFRGQRKTSIPSGFLVELPRAEMELLGPSGKVLSCGVQPEESTPATVAAAAGNGNQAGVSRRKAAEETTPPPRLTTAAELAHPNAPLPPLSPDVFALGMIVRHPAHGLGKIVALSGSGANRKATVDFISPPARKKFLLSASPLRPVKP